MCCYRSRLVFICCFSETDISQGSEATQLRCRGIFSNSIITNFLLILRVKSFASCSVFEEVIRRRPTKMCQFLGHPVVTSTCSRSAT